MEKFSKSLKRLFKRLDYRAFIYGAFSNWGLVILANIIGAFFINTIGIDIVRRFTPLIYLILGAAFFLPAPKSKDFRLGYLIAFIIGILFLTLFYYPLF